MALAILGYRKDSDKRYIVGGCFALVAGVGLAVILKSKLYTGNYWVAPVVNSIGYWTLGCALIALLIMSTVYVAFKARDGVKLANYGVSLPIVGCDGTKAALEAIQNGTLTATILNDAYNIAGYGAAYRCDRLCRAVPD